MEDIKAIIEQYQLNKKDRHRPNVYMRYYLMYVAYTRSELSLAIIGRMFNKHHSSVLHGIAEHKKWMRANDPIYLYHTKPVRDLIQPKINRKNLYHCKHTPYQGKRGKGMITLTGYFDPKFNDLDKKMTVNEFYSIFNLPH